MVVLRNLHTILTVMLYCLIVVCVILAFQVIPPEKDPSIVKTFLIVMMVVIYLSLVAIVVSGIYLLAAKTLKNALILFAALVAFGFVMVGAFIVLRFIIFQS